MKKQFKDISGYFEFPATGQRWLKINSKVPIIMGGSLQVNAICIDENKLGIVGAFFDNDEVNQIGENK